MWGQMGVGSRAAIQSQSLADEMGAADIRTICLSSATARHVIFLDERPSRAFPEGIVGFRRTRMWRSGRDSNPRYGFAVYSLSRRAPSTTRPPLRKSLEGDASRVARRNGQGCRA